MESRVDRSHDDQTWERRRYWQDGKLVRFEWWRDNQYAADGPAAPQVAAQPRDFCYRHGTPIYANLGCQICRQRTGKLCS
jgi:hypothetical protein